MEDGSSVTHSEKEVGETEIQDQLRSLSSIIPKFLERGTQVRNALDEGAKSLGYRRPWFSDNAGGREASTIMQSLEAVALALQHVMHCWLVAEFERRIHGRVSISKEVGKPE